MRVVIELSKKAVVNDVLVRCNLVGRMLQKTEGGAAVAAEVMTPDDEERLPVIARALTEAFGEVKRICQAYLVKGRTAADNRLQGIGRANEEEETVEVSPEGGNGYVELIPGLPYSVEVDAGEERVRVYAYDGTARRLVGEVHRRGVLAYTPSCRCESLIFESVDDVVFDALVTYRYTAEERYLLRMELPCGFNDGITDTIKDCAHRMLVDYAVASVLNLIVPETGSEYSARFAADTEGLRSALRARKCFGRRSAEDWA